MKRARLELGDLEWAEELAYTAESTVRRQAIALWIRGPCIFVPWDDHFIFSFGMLFIVNAVCSNQIVSYQYLRLTWRAHTCYLYSRRGASISLLRRA